MTLQMNHEHEFGMTAWWTVLRIMDEARYNDRDAIWRRWGTGTIQPDVRLIITRDGRTPRELRMHHFNTLINDGVTAIREQIAQVFPHITPDFPFAPWDAIMEDFAEVDFRTMVLWETEAYLYYTRNTTPRLMMALRERYAYILKKDFNLPFIRIAAMLGLRGESTARAHANRFVRRTGAPPITADGGERRRIAGQAAAAQRWGATRRTTEPVVPQIPKLGRTFGVEIEYGAANMKEVQLAIAAALGVPHIHVFGYHGTTCQDCGVTVARSYTEWKIEHDSSVTRGTFPRATGGEVVSPILRGTDGFDQIAKVVKAIRDCNGTINKRCGLHVHVDMRNFTATGRAKVVASWRNWQTEITKIVARSRHNNTYCRQISKYEADLWVDQILRGNEQVGDRYRTLNTTPFPRIGTYEFRLHQGTLNAKKIVAWVKFLVAFAEMAAADGDAGTPVGDGIARTTETITDLLDMLVKRHDDTNQEFGLRAPDANFIKRRVAQPTNTTN